MESFESFLKLTKESQEQTPFNAIVVGSQGSGKSTMIKYMTSRLTVLKIGFKICAFTGTAAHNVQGTTIHSLLGLRHTDKHFERIAFSDSSSLEKKLVGMEFLIVEEYSICGARLLSLLNKKLQAVFKTTQDWGGRSVIFFGDFMQLGCIKDNPVWSDPDVLRLQKRFFAAEGAEAFRRVKKIFKLFENVRQKDCQNYFYLLQNVRDKCLSCYDLECLETRFEQNMNATSRAEFKDAIHLFPSRVAANFLNQAKLLALDQPIAKIPVCYSPEQTVSRPCDMPLYLALGCRVIVRNLWVEAGLTNGAMGSVRALLYKNNEGPPKYQPEVLLVEFDNYKGPTVFKNSVPITAVQDFLYYEDTYQKKSIPLLNANGITIHKAQGLTLNKAVIQLGLIETFPSLSYVSLSRLRRIEDLLIIPLYYKETRFSDYKFFLGYTNQLLESLRLGLIDCEKFRVLSFKNSSQANFLPKSKMSKISKSNSLPEGLDNMHSQAIEIGSTSESQNGGPEQTQNPQSADTNSIESAHLQAAEATNNKLIEIETEKEEEEKEEDQPEDDQSPLLKKLKTQNNNCSE